MCGANLMGVLYVALSIFVLCVWGIMMLFNVDVGVLVFFVVTCMKCADRFGCYYI